MTIFNSWRGMKSRCNNKKDSHYKYYGDKNIKICSEWENYKNFEKWSLENGYKEGLSIDRIDVTKNYSPENCRWVDNKTQARNKTDNTFITYKGATKTIAEWSEITGLKYNTILNRLRVSKWKVEDIFKPIRQYEKYEYKGECNTLHSWAKKKNVPYVTLWHRVVKQNMSIEEALNVE